MKKPALYGKHITVAGPFFCVEGDVDASLASAFGQKNAQAFSMPPPLQPRPA
jgi:hypothetical protein